MDGMTDYHLLWAAIGKRDFAELRRLVEGGTDPNARSEDGEPLLHAVELWAPNYDIEPSEDASGRHAMVRTLVELGADPTLLDAEGNSILMGPIFAQDTKMMDLLMEHGVDPNRGCGDRWETVYDLARFDYWAMTGTHWGAATGEPTEDEQADDDAFLNWLDREAVARGWSRPVCLFRLRRYGALSGREMARRLGGESSERIEWRDDRWCLVEGDGAARLEN